jgi:hypothetical protein
MKSFKQYISEDIIGGYDPNYIYRENLGPKKIKSLDQLVKKIGVNYDLDNLNSTRVDLNDQYHIRYVKYKSKGDDRTPPRDLLAVHVFSSAPGHERTALAEYKLSHDPNNVVKTSDGREIKMFSGSPEKVRRDTKRGVFSLPKNILHTIANSTGYGIMSGFSQTKGGTELWRKAVRHGHESGHHVSRMYQFSKRNPETRKISSEWKVVGKSTPRTFQDAYTGDVSLRKTGNKSRIPKRDFDLPPEKNVYDTVTRLYTHLGILPK